MRLIPSTAKKARPSKHLSLYKCKETGDMEVLKVYSYNLDRSPLETFILLYSTRKFSCMTEKLRWDSENYIQYYLMLEKRKVIHDPHLPNFPAFSAVEMLLTEGR